MDPVDFRRLMYFLILMHRNVCLLAVVWLQRQRVNRLRDMISCLTNRVPRRRPVVWMSLQSICPSWYDMVLMNSGDQVWVNELRLTRGTVEELCAKVGAYMSPSDGGVREPIPLHKRVCIGLYKLASSGEYRTTAKAFGVSKTSVHRCVYLLCNALCSIKTTYLQWYTTDDAIALAEETKRKYGYPQAIGAIDGTHVPIVPPLDGKADYICRKMYGSVVLQAVVDGNYMFRDVYANCPGSMHDASVFRRSPLYDRIHTRMPQHTEVLAGIPVPLHIVGDPAYPIGPQLMKGFTGRNLSPEQESFNVYLSSARISVEIAFGRLKKRWRMFQKPLDVHHTFASRAITACCVLHNICEINRIEPPDLERHQVASRTFEQPGLVFDASVDREGGVVRDAIKTYLANNLPLRRSFHL